jgi:hypothetical protein
VVTIRPSCPKSPHPKTVPAENCISVYFSPRGTNRIPTLSPMLQKVMDFFASIK